MPVKTKKGKKSPPVSGASCAICDNEVASEEIAKCIECKKTAHRYCAGVPIDEMASDSGCYTCQLLCKCTSSFVKLVSPFRKPINQHIW